MKKSFLIFLVITMISASGIIRSNAQTPDNVFEQGTISEQMQYLEDRTRIYENYRAIREDMFQNLSRNVLDTIASVKRSLSGIILQNATLENRVDSFQMALQNTDKELSEVTRTKNSISFLGIGINKTAYNGFMWTILIILAGLLAAGYKIFIKNRITTMTATRELEDLRIQFEEHKKKARMERERMSTEHFNELRKLRGK